MDFEHIDVAEGEWLFLARNNYLLNQVEDYLKKSGRFYQRSGKSPVSDTLINAIKDWEKLRKGQKLEADNIRKIYSYMRAGKGVKTGYKTLKSVLGDTILGMDDLKRDYGLLVDKIWHESFDLIGITQREYLISCLRRKENLNTSRIKLSTIHASKGGECDNVVLLSDMASKSYDELYKNPDNECRNFYVGVTRTKQNLHIVRSRTRRQFNF